MTPVLIGVEGPSFGGLKPQNRGQTGSRYVIFDLFTSNMFCFNCIILAFYIVPIL